MRVEDSNIGQSDSNFLSAFMLFLFTILSLLFKYAKLFPFCHVLGTKCIKSSVFFFSDISFSP